MFQFNEVCMKRALGKGEYLRLPWNRGCDLAHHPKDDDFDTYLGGCLFTTRFFLHWTHNFQLLSWDDYMIPTHTLLHEKSHWSQVWPPIVNHGCIGVVQWVLLWANIESKLCLLILFENIVENGEANSQVANCRSKFPLMYSFSNDLFDDPLFTSLIELYECPSSVFSKVYGMLYETAHF